MNKTQLIEKLAKDLGVTVVLARRFVDGYHETIAAELAKENDVTLMGFGTFSAKHREAREGRNPATGEAITIGPSRYPSFRAGKNLKETVAL